MRHPGRPGGRRGEGVAAGPTPTSPDPSPARAWTSWTSPAAWRRAPARHPGAAGTGRFTAPGAEIALSALASGLLELLCQRHPTASPRPPSTSSPALSCACSASPPTRPPAAFGASESARTRALFVFAGLISVAFGVVLCARPHVGAITLALLSGLFNLIFGIWMVVQGIELRRTGKTLDSSLPEKQPA